jgi:hypothetical protein
MAVGTNVDRTFEVSKRIEEIIHKEVHEAQIV